MISGVRKMEIYNGEPLPVVLYDKVSNRRKHSEVHSHNHYELYYLADGKTKYFIGDEIFEMEQGDIAFVPKGVFHETDSENCMKNERILIFFNDDAFPPASEHILNELCQNRVIHISKNKTERIERMFVRIRNEFENPGKYSRELMNIYILELATLICRHKMDYKNSNRSANEDIYAISQYIRTNYSKDISLKSLSHDFAISESHLSRKFKDASGIGINEYITYVRIMNAEKLLKAKKMPITHVAAACGFNDSNYFSTVFKKIKGITPLKYSKTTDYE